MAKQEARTKYGHIQPKHEAKMCASCSLDMNNMGKNWGRAQVLPGTAHRVNLSITGTPPGMKIQSTIEPFQIIFQLQTETLQPM